MSCLTLKYAYKMFMSCFNLNVQIILKIVHQVFYVANILGDSSYLVGSWSDPFHKETVTKLNFL